ncbi:hypothetical protein HYFRA_00001963 [Hymenoscyphus fraxineus]|uniref:DUF1993 domain-containing protein n=1 Tax=Hymenoscyphus fraxineus TaxID=746836 RepID=A0A9N9KMS8_9HELO|nr:hypothetical protein HYFRA_00001963 [Hymenoscyphus fraxineus]
MPFSLYDITVPVFIRDLNILQNILKRGVEHASTSSSSEKTILESRLIADMEAFPYQIQRLSDCVKGLCVRMGGVAPQAWADEEKTLAELQERVKKTIELLETVDPKSMDGKEDLEIVIGPYTFTGTTYVQQFVIPNFYFHHVMTYALLRKEGVQIGKRNYLGHVV